MQPGTPDSFVPRRERERGLRRSAMLAAARQVLAEKGFADTTIEEITHRAEFGKGTLYNYFPGGKEEVLLAIVSDLYDDLAALVEGSFAGDAGLPAREQFRNFMSRVFAYFTERRELFLILMKEAHRMGFSGDGERVRFYLAQREKVATALLAPIRSAIDSGQMRPLPPDAIVHMLLGNIQGLQMQLALQSTGATCDTRTWSPEEASSIVATILFDGLLTDPARHEPGSNPGFQAHV
jgi:TetR/AcrR family transcriptional regulator, repressor of fatR-cypB operon